MSQQILSKQQAIIAKKYLERMLELLSNVTLTDKIKIEILKIHSEKEELKRKFPEIFLV